MESQRCEITHSSDHGGLVCQGGVVTGVEGRRVQILIDAQKGCESCGSRGHCGALFGGTTMLELETDRALQIGQKVEIGMQPAAVLTASGLLFLFPAVAFIIGILAGYGIAPVFSWNPQWTGFAGGIGMGAFSYLVIRLVTGRLQQDGGYQPVITRVFD